ncbi:MAG: hypothetical protein HC924_07585 [Synechococcaceae cyanobacterium SM2_3_2]|nr:hypothetical protein [Synechococcaceae cyanobacterium SM2_3_2]
MIGIGKTSMRHPAWLFIGALTRALRIPSVCCALLMGGLGIPAAQAGDYFTEEVTSPSIEVVHGWLTTIQGREVTVTNTSRGGLNVPLEIEGTGCGEVEMDVISTSQVQLLGSMRNCSLNLFPFLDKLINRDAAALRVALEGGSILEIPLDDDDRLILARVGNQSREGFLTFQAELSRVLELFQQANETAGIPIPTPVPTVAPTPTPAPAQSSQLVIVGQIEEETVGAGTRLRVTAINPTTVATLSAQARFDFFLGEEQVDTRQVAFSPRDVPPGEQATAEVIKTDSNWDRVTVIFEWLTP